MIPELREPLAEGGKFGWPVGLIGAALAGYYLIGSLTSTYSGRLGDTIGARKLLAAGGLLFGTSMILIGFITQIWQFFIVYSVMLALTIVHHDSPADGRREPLVQAPARIGYRPDVGGGRIGRSLAGAGLFGAACPVRLDHHIRLHWRRGRRYHAPPGAFLPQPAV